MKQRRAPTREAWGDLSADPEVKYAFELFGTKTVEEATPLFADNPIERAAELRFSPAPVFNYYVFCFASFLMTPKAQGEADAASCFLRLVRDRMRSDPKGIAGVYPELKPAIDAVSARQAFYDADENIYGSFLDLSHEIEALHAAEQ